MSKLKNVQPHTHISVGMFMYTVKWKKEKTVQSVYIMCDSILGKSDDTNILYSIFLLSVCVHIDEEEESNTRNPYKFITLDVTGAGWRVEWGGKERESVCTVNIFAFVDWEKSGNLPENVKKKA